MKYLIVLFLAGCTTVCIPNTSDSGIHIHTNGDAGPDHDADLRLLP